MKNSRLRRGLDESKEVVSFLNVRVEKVVGLEAVDFHTYLERRKRPACHRFPRSQMAYFWILRSFAFFCVR